MKKNDIILIVVILVLAAAGYIGIQLYGKATTDKEAMVVVKIEGEEYMRLPLNEDTTVKIETKDGGYNILRISDGKADIIDASCPDKLCVHQKEISAHGEMLVCLPNKVTVEVENGEKADYDAVAN